MIIVAGPCAIEEPGDWLAKWALDLVLAFEPYEKLGWELIIKGSFDKANRTALDGPRGIGLLPGLEALDRASQLTGCRTTTDFHEPWQIEDMWEVPPLPDIIQIPAMLGRQTDLIQAAAATGKIVNIKKPQFLAADKVAPMCHKALGAEEVWLTHRGTLYGPDTLIVDPLDIGPLLSREGKDFDRLFLDITHTNRGVRSASLGLAKVGASLGISGFFMEVHRHPENAICDGKHQLTIDYFRECLAVIAESRQA